MLAYDEHDFLESLTRDIGMSILTSYALRKQYHGLLSSDCQIKEMDHKKKRQTKKDMLEKTKG